MPYEAPKSVGHEETFEHDLDDDEEILRELLALSGQGGLRLRADGYRARTVTLKARLANFTTLTRSRTLADATDVGADLYHVGRRAVPGAAGGAAPDPAAGRAGERLWSGRRRAARAAARRAMGATWSAPIDRIEQRFGRGAAMPASLLDRERRRLTRAGRGCSGSIPCREPLPIIVEEPDARTAPEDETRCRSATTNSGSSKRSSDGSPRTTRGSSNRSAAPISTRTSLGASGCAARRVRRGLRAAAAVRRESRGSRRSGFVVMVLSALLLYRYLGQLGRDQIRAMQQDGRCRSPAIARPARGALPSAATAAVATE